jgi:hypothetical protein
MRATAEITKRATNSYRAVTATLAPFSLSLSFRMPKRTDACGMNLPHPRATRLLGVSRVDASTPTEQD